MTHQATGTVVALTTRNITSKAGKSFPKHGVKLDSGQEFEWEGFKQLATVGQAMTDVAVAQKYKVWTATGVRATPGTPAMPALVTPAGVSAATGGGSTGGGGSRDSGFPIPQSNYQTAIIRQNALTNAAAVVNALLGDTFNDAPTADVQKELDARSDTIIRLAYKFAAFSSGQLDAMVAETMASEVRGLIAKGNVKSGEE